MYVSVLTFCSICNEDIDALILDCDSCVEQLQECEHLRCTECSSDI